MLMPMVILSVLVAREAGAMEVTRTVSSFTRSRVRLQHRGRDNQTLHEVVEARFAAGAPVLPAAGLLGKPSASIRACQNVSKLSNEVKIGKSQSPQSSISALFSGSR